MVNYEFPWKLYISFSANFTLISNGMLEPATKKKTICRNRFLFYTEKSAIF